VFGRIPDVAKSASSDFKKVGSTIVLVGNPDFMSMGGSAYFDAINHKGHSPIPKVDIQMLPRVFEKITRGIDSGDILSVHDISDGGLAVTISEMCFGAGFGAEIDIARIGKIRSDFVLFNETAGTFIVEVESEKMAKKLFSNVPHVVLGKTYKENVLRITNGKQNILQSPISSLKRAWQKPMKEYF